MVQLRFNEGVAPAVINLIDATGKKRTDVTVKAVDQSILITLPDNLPRGDPSRQLSRDLAGRPSRRRIPDLLDRGGDRNAGRSAEGRRHA